MSKDNMSSKDQSRILEGANVSKPQKGFDFISRYVKFFSKITDAPREFQEAAALFLISTAVALKWIFKSMPETSIFNDKSIDTGRLLNLWFCLIGKSRITRKTSGVLRHVRDLSEKVFGRQRMLTEAFTPEALIKEMAEKSTPSSTRNSETVCCWICDEISGFFQKIKKRDSYLASADAFLSKIYDGSTYTRGTIGRGIEIVWNPYLTCLLASTEYLPTLFDELQIRLGFLNRFVYVIGERKERIPLRTHPLTVEEKKETKEIVAFLETLAEKNSVTTLEMTSEAKQLYDYFEADIEDQIEHKDLGIKEGYCGQLPNLVVRLSCLYRISRMTPEEIQTHNKPVLFVENRDVERAIEYAWKAWTWFERVIEIMRKPQARRGKKGILTAKGRQIVVEMLKKGPKKREHFFQASRRAGISISLLDNQILRSLVKDKIVRHDKFGWYSLVTNNAHKTQENRGDDDEGG